MKRLAWGLAAVAVLGTIACAVAGDWWTMFGVVWQGGILLVASKADGPVYRDPEPTLERGGW